MTRSKNRSSIGSRQPAHTSIATGSIGTVVDDDGRVAVDIVISSEYTNSNNKNKIYSLESLGQMRESACAWGREFLYRPKHCTGSVHWRRQLWGTCPLDFQLFNFSGHFRAAQTINIRHNVVACPCSKNIQTYCLVMLIA